MTPRAPLHKVESGWSEVSKLTCEAFTVAPTKSMLPSIVPPCPSDRSVVANIGKAAQDVIEGLSTTAAEGNRPRPSGNPPCVRSTRSTPFTEALRAPGEVASKPVIWNVPASVALVSPTHGAQKKGSHLKYVYLVSGVLPPPCHDRGLCADGWAWMASTRRSSRMV